MSKQQQTNTGTKTQQQAKVAPVSKGSDKKPTFNFNFAKDEIILFDKNKLHHYGFRGCNCCIRFYFYVGRRK
jgi:hypothetical protein